MLGAGAALLLVRGAMTDAFAMIYVCALHQCATVMDDRELRAIFARIETERARTLEDVLAEAREER